MESRHTAPDGVAAFLAHDINSNFCHEFLGLKGSTQLPGTSLGPAQQPVRIFLQHRSMGAQPVLGSSSLAGGKATPVLERKT